MTNSFTQTRLWKTTLGLLDQGADQEHVDRLRESYLLFRKHVEPLAKEIAISVPAYTDHSIDHCDALWDAASVIAGDLPLNPAEAFVLGGSFLLHDLAMGLSAYRGGLVSILDSTDWVDLLASLYPQEWRDLNRQALSDVSVDPTWNGLTSPRVKSALTIFLREHHAWTAENLLSQQWELSSGSPFTLLPDIELCHWYGTPIGQLARSHWQDVGQLPTLFSEELGSMPTLPRDWTVDQLKIACLLRTADAAQVDARRANVLHTPFRNPQGSSADHWHFQERMLRPRLVDDRLIYTSSVPFTPTFADAWWLAYEAIRMIHGELASVDSLRADMGERRLAARGVAGADSPARFAKHVKTAGWTPIDARPYIGDADTVIARLGGEALYGRDAQRVGIRELVANACDATRARTKAYPTAPTVRPVQLLLDVGVEHDVLTIRDFGIGMSRDDIVEYLCNFGSSGWHSPRFRSEFSGALSGGFDSTGRFGIGFFATFMIADQVVVTTRSVHSSTNDTWVLTFAHGLQGRPILRRAEGSERLIDPGTSVRLVLKEPLFHTFTNEPEFDADLELRTLQFELRNMCLLADSDIILRLTHAGVATEVPIVAKEQWRTATPSELFDLMYDDGAMERIPGLYEKRALFTTVVRPMYGEDGDVVGRLGLASELFWTELWNGRVYCGGFEASFLADSFIGVIAGSESRASRDEARPLVTLAEAQRWFSEQAEMLGGTANANRSFEALEAQYIGLMFGLRTPTFPIALTSAGFLLPDEFREWCKARDTVHILPVLSWLSLSDVSAMRPSFYSPYANKLLRIDETCAVTTSGRSTLWSRRTALPTVEIPAEEGVANLIGEGAMGQLARAWQLRPGDPESEITRLVASAWGLRLGELLSKDHVIEYSRRGVLLESEDGQSISYPCNGFFR